MDGGRRFIKVLLLYGYSELKIWSVNNTFTYRFPYDKCRATSLLDLSVSKYRMEQQRQRTFAHSVCTAWLQLCSTWCTFEVALRRQGLSAILYRTHVCCCNVAHSGPTCSESPEDPAVENLYVGFSLCFFLLFFYVLLSSPTVCFPIWPRVN